MAITSYYWWEIVCAKTLANDLSKWKLYEENAKFL